VRPQVEVGLYPLTLLPRARPAFFDVDGYHAHDSYRVGHIGFYFYKRNPDVPLIFLKKAFREIKDMHNATLHGW
jgi:hypothetical protein